MKIRKDLEPIVSGISAAIVIGILAFFTLETSAGVWLMFSFGATVFIVFVLYDLENFRPFRQALDMGMKMDVPPARGEFKLLVWRDFLIAEEDYTVIQQSLVNAPEGDVIQRI